MFRRLISAAALLTLVFTAFTFMKFAPIKIGASGKIQVVEVAGRTPTLTCPGPIFVNGGSSGTKLGDFTQSGIAVLDGVNGKTRISQFISSQTQLTGEQDGSKTFNAVQSQLAKGPNAFGLASANCTPGTNDAWIVAGDNSIGREALLILVNPSEVDATVSLELIGTSGAIEGSGLGGISAPAGKTTVLPLASFAPKAGTFAVHVTSRGANLGVYLQQKTIRGVTPGGLELVSTSAPASKKVVIPGIFLRTTAKLTALQTADQNFSDTTPILRVTAPGDRDVTFTAQVLGADGDSFGTVIQGNVPANSTKDFEITDVADGNYSVQIEASEPVLGAVRYSRATANVADFAWASSVKSAKLSAGFTSPAGSVSKLSVANPSGKLVKVKLGSRTYEVHENANIVIEVAAGSSFAITSDGEVAASLVVDRQGSVAVVPVIDYLSTGGSVRVAIR